MNTKQSRRNNWDEAMFDDFMDEMMSFAEINEKEQEAAEDEH